MVYKPRSEDTIDASELTGEGEPVVGEAEPTPEHMATVEKGVMESTRAMNALGERTPAETAQIEALQETLSAQKIETEPTLVAGASQGEEITPEGLEMAKVNSDLEEYLGDNPNEESLEARLVDREEANRDSEKKSFKRFGWAGAGVGAASGVSALASAGGLGGAAMAGGFGAAALGGLFAAPAIIAVGGAYWGGKKLWNKYKENKARKNIDIVRGDR